MSALTDHLLDNLRVRLPGALDGVLRQEVFFAVDEMCRQAYIYRKTVEIPLSVGSSIYPINAPGEVVTALFIEHVTLDMSKAIMDPVQKLVSIGQKPTAADIVTPLFAHLVLAPIMEPVIELDDLISADLWVKWGDAIKDGVLGRMMSQSAKPYSNLQLGTYHMKRFRSAMGTARHLTNTGHVPGAQLWSFPKWA